MSVVRATPRGTGGQEPPAGDGEPDDDGHAERDAYDGVPLRFVPAGVTPDGSVAVFAPPPGGGG